MKKYFSIVLVTAFVLFGLVIGHIAKATIDLPTITISATKIVCDNESDLPNWGAGGHIIDANTASNYITAKEGKCHLQSGWSFQWGDQNAPDGGSTTVGPVSGYTTFGPTDANGNVSTQIPLGNMTEIHLREILQDGYIPFTGQNTTQDVSAEFYCANDALNYDNWDFIRNPQAGTTYNCVAFNALKEQQQPKQCDVVSDTTNIVEGGTNAVATYDTNPAWTHAILGATWIWDALHVANPTTEETKTFVKEFNLDSAPTSASIDIATDNGFILDVNGVEIVNKITEEFNYGATQSYPVTNLVSGVNTIKITVKNFAQSGGDYTTNPAGVLYKLHVVGSGDCSDVTKDACPNVTGFQAGEPCADTLCVAPNIWNTDSQTCETPVVPPTNVCDPNVNLIQNGDFEQPSVAPGTYSIIPDTNPLLKWLVAWVGATPSTGTLGLEIQNNIAGTPFAGSQLAELDGDHPVSIWQNIPTIPGDTYNLDFEYSPRAGRDLADNEITVKIDDSAAGSPVSADGTSNTNTVWTPQTRSFVATNSTTKVEFADTGTDTSYGGYLDNISLRCWLPQEPKGSIQITKYICPADTSVVRTSNGVGGIIPQGCVLQSGKTFGYVHGTQTNANSPFPELSIPLTTGGSTTDGVLTINNLPADGRYLIEETNSDNIKIPDGDILGLYCEGDGDTSNNNDNQELTFVHENQTSHCVAYNKLPPPPPPTDVCPNIEGNQATVPEGMEINNDGQCVEIVNPPTDVCPNIEGNQATVPDGMEINNNGQCVEIVNPSTPTTNGGSNGGHGGRLLTHSVGQVLGAEASCGIYVDKFLRKGLKGNDKEAVIKVQKFLNDYMAAGLTLDGVFGPGTEAALKAFQLKYADKILTPWKLTNPTGVFYLTTQTEVNNIMCPDLGLPIPTLVPYSQNPLTPKI
jgi:hypothetical protein